jgi:hypothetical protein
MTGGRRTAPVALFQNHGSLQQALGAQPAMPPPVGGSFAEPISNGEATCRAERVQLAGGALNNVLTNEATQPFEQLFRKLPEQGIHSPLVSPSRPFKFELGSFLVPKQMSLVLFDFRPDIYRFSGIDPNDAVPVEARRFATQIGYEVTIDGNHPANLRFELEPVPRESAVEFQPTGTDVIENPGRQPSQSEYNAAQRNSFGAAAGAGLSTLPQRPFRFGAPSLPMSLILREDQVFAAKAIFFKPVTSPIAFIEWDMAGILTPANMLTELLECLRPV